MTLTQIKLLIEIYKSGFNLSEATEKMHVVQSAGSRQLKLLEEELGFPVFMRKGQRLIGFTQVGEKVFEQAKQICMAEHNIKRIVETMQSQDEGCIRLGTTHTQARYILPSVLEQFILTHPKIKLHIEESSPENLYHFLKLDKIDVAICSELISKQDDLVSGKAYNWEHVLIAPHHHPIWDTDLSLRNCLHFPILSYMKGFTHSDKVLQAFRKIDEGFEFDIVASDADVIKTYVKKDFGLGVIAQMAFEEEDKQHFKCVPLGHQVGKSATYYAHLSKRYLPPYLDDFISLFLQTVLQRFG